MPEYPKVKKAHIVPRMYLAKWAVAGKIGVRLVREGETLVQPIENVGIRRSFYRRHRPDGTEIDDVEWTLSEIEKNAAPVLASLEDDWPLGSDAKPRAECPSSGGLLAVGRRAGMRRDPLSPLAAGGHC